MPQERFSPAETKLRPTALTVRTEILGHAHGHEIYVTLEGIAKNKRAVANVSELVMLCFVAVKLKVFEVAKTLATPDSV